MRRWCGAALCAVAFFVLLPAPRVAAHASFIDSNPVDGSVLAEAPTVAELRFTEPVLITASKVQLLHLGTEQSTRLQLSTAHGGTTLLAEMPKLRAWRVHLALRRRRSGRPPQDGRVDLLRHRRRRAAVGIRSASRQLVAVDRPASHHRWRPLLLGGRCSRARGAARSQRSASTSTMSPAWPHQQCRGRRRLDRVAVG